MRFATFRPQFTLRELFFVITTLCVLFGLRSLVVASSPKLAELRVNSTAATSIVPGLILAGLTLPLVFSVPAVLSPRPTRKAVLIAAGSISFVLVGDLLLSFSGLRDVSEPTAKMIVWLIAGYAGTIASLFALALRRLSLRACHPSGRRDERQLGAFSGPASLSH